MFIHGLFEQLDPFSDGSGQCLVRIRPPPRKNPPWKALQRRGYEDYMEKENPGKVLKLKQAAAVLQCHPKTLRLMAQAGKIPARRVGKLWRFSADRLREWIEAS